ncbi:MAG TPA: caspase family protein [Coleofasciculaceae cyanobacterium]|jgi:WD40 repeat protein
MKRQALVVGINNYAWEDNLPTATTDAEAVARLLEQYGDFEVHRLPTQGSMRRVEPEKEVYLEELEEAIIRLFHPKSGIIPEMGLLFFAGHGDQQPTHDGKTEGFLTTSEAGSVEDKGFLSLKWLRQLLQDSPVRQQIVWLDCCHSGELFNFIDTDLGEYKKGRDRCFIAACREFQVAYGGVLTPALLRGLDPINRVDGWVTNYSLTDFIEQALKDAPQHIVCRNTGGQILLSGKNGVRGNICPYKGLEYFDFNPEVPQKAEDPKYFYGRTALTKQLSDAVQERNCLAVLGASGSGKSSVVRAGLLYQLYLGEEIRGSDRWKIYPPFTPGEHPLQRLKEVVEVEAEQLEPLIKAAADRVVLVVDQFEEVFTQCRDKDEREKFFKYLMGAVERLGKKVCLVLVMRDDFQHKCAEQEYAGLATKIDQNLVRVRQMNPQELMEAITKPAEQVGLELDRELVTKMIEDVESSPGDLPLLQYTLTELWKQRQLYRLTISDYTRLGGVKKALEKHANEVYESFKTEEEKRTAKQIFLELTHLGQGTEDTRRQVCQQDLVSEKRSPELVVRVVQRLAKEKLVITGEQEVEGKQVAVVNIAHEALIRNWDLLGKWLKENREALLRKQDIEDAAKDWRDNRKQGEEAYLLQGTRLATAEDYLQRYGDTVPLSGLAQEFVRRSIKHRQSSRRNLIVTITAVILGLSGLAGWALIEGEDARIRADSASSESLFAADRKLEALVASIRAGRRRKGLLGTIGAKADTRIQSVTAVEQAVYGVRERNRLDGHRQPVLDVNFSPDGQIIASTSDDGTVRLWKPDGTLLTTLSENSENKARDNIMSSTIRISGVSFSPNGQIMAVSVAGSTIKLMSRDGKLLRTLKHNDNASRSMLGITRVTFSPDGQLVASGGNDYQIRLQTLDGKLLAILSGHKSWVNSVTFSPNGRTIASGSGDGSVNLWSREGSLLRTLQHNYVQPGTKKHIGNVREGSDGQGIVEDIWSVSFSPDSQTIASAGEDGTVKLWKLNGRLLATLSGHRGRVKSVSFSPDGRIIASASGDNTIKIWKNDGTLITTFTGHSSTVNRASFSPDGQMIVSASDDGTVRLWPLRINSIFSLKGHSSSVTSVSFSPDGRMIASTGKDHTVKLWSRDGALLKTLSGHGDIVNNVSFSPDSRLIASASKDRTIRLWSRDGTLLKTLSGRFQWSINGVSFSPDGRMIASTGLGAIELWRRDGTPLSTINSRVDDYLRSVTFSPDGQIIASHGEYKPGFNVAETVELWQLDGKLITRLTGHSVSFSPDGQMIASASKDGVVRLWKRDGKLITNLTGHSQYVTSISFSPDSQMIASASKDATVKLWSRNGTLLKTLEHPADVNGLNFSLDGKTLATAVDNGTVLLWNLDLDDLLGRGCNWVRGYLEHNPNISEEDRRLCKGIKPLRS